MSEFAGVDSNQTGTKIWRIEKMVPVLQDPKFHGQFYAGDAYICLFSVKRETSSTIDHDIHFLLGSECSQDEAGVAAYKTVELDDQLGGAATQHREVQDHESPQFLAKFPAGITYLEGGVDSGFNHVERDVYEPMLLHLKGKRNVRTKQVKLEAASLNDDDVFILDNGLTLYQWTGKTANRYEKVKALEVITAIKDNQRGGRAQMVFLESGDDDDADFWALLGGKPASIKADDGDDAAAEKAAKGEIKLVHISDESGTLEFKPIEERPLKKEHLDTNDAFLLSTGDNVFVWTGKGSNSTERKEGFKFAAEFIQKEGLADWTPVTRIIEGGETPLFKQNFVWPENYLPMPNMVVAGVGRGVAKTPEQHEIDVAALHNNKFAKDSLTLDPEGTITVYRIENFDKTVVDPSLHGQFYAGDSFLVVYEWPANSGNSPFVAAWQGRDSTTDEKGTSALLMKQIDDEQFNGRAVQVRVVQGKEPNWFLSLFKGRMVIHEGGVASGFKNKDDADSMDTDGVSLFHIKGTTPENTRAVQTQEVAASLCSADCFVLLTPGKMFAWNGKGASESEVAAAKSISELLAGDREVVTLAEGEEPEEFWTPLGGKGEYASEAALQDAPHEPRLFEMSDASGVLNVEEIPDFTQDDLLPSEIYLLDTFTAVYLWIGNEASANEKKLAPTIAEKYQANAVDGRDVSAPVITIEAGNEPLLFTCHFAAWDPSKATVFVDPYQARLEEQRKAKEAKAAEEAAAAPEDPAAAPESAPTKAAVTVAAGSTTYDIELLKSTTPEADRPAGIDWANREQYLSDEQFQAALGMDKAAFGALAGWKKAEAKKKALLW